MGRRTFVAGLAACLMLGTVVTGAGSAVGQEPDQRPELGAWGAPFSEDGAYDAAPPQTADQSLDYPPAVSVVVMPDGRILYWGGLEGLEDSNYPIAADAGRSAQLSRARILELTADGPEFSTPDVQTGGETDMFCADQRVLPDGRILITGGTIYRSDPVENPLDLGDITGNEDLTGPDGTAELFGSVETRIFDPANGDFTFSGDPRPGMEMEGSPEVPIEPGIEPMDHGRWYPTLITLPSGKQFVAGGVERLIYNTTGFNVAETEIFDPETQRWTPTGESGSTTLPLFARLHLLPRGDVFYPAAGQMWSPFGQSADEALWNLHKAYDPDENTWTTTGIGAYGARSGAFSTLLPIRPDPDGNYPDEARILLGGGVLGVSPGTYVATDLTEIVTVGPTEDGTLGSSSEESGRLNNRRWYSSGVLLPDGSVLAVSGADKDEVVLPGSEAPVREAELWDPETGEWTALASASRDRTYHNTAVLLPDGRVLVGGHSPINAGYGAKGNGTGDTTIYGNDATEGILANNLKDPSFEIYSPPYLFSGDRPEIEDVRKGLAWQRLADGSENPAGEAQFVVNTSDADEIDEVVLVRLPSTTHITDADMRLVELPIESAQGSALHVASPPDPNIAPPGYYYLFVLDEGVPSVARVVHVGEEPSVADA